MRMVKIDHGGARVRKGDKELASPRNIKKAQFDGEMELEEGYEVEWELRNIGERNNDDEFPEDMPINHTTSKVAPVLSSNAGPPRPARLRNSSFGDDEDLAAEPPLNWTLRKFQEQVQALLKEYYVANAVNDTVASFGDVLKECPCEADELGVLTMRAALDRDATAETTAVALVKGLHGAGLLDTPAIVRCFEKLFCTWQDLAIDVPRAPAAILSLLHKCIVAEVVGKKLLTKIPENLLDAGVANVDQDFKAMVDKVATDLKTFKRQVSRCLEEYFVASGASEIGCEHAPAVETFLRDLKMEIYHHELVKKAIVLSFSQTPESAGREAVVSLMAQLTASSIVCKDDLQWGFTRLLSQLDDIALDHPRLMELATEVGVSFVAEELVSVPFLRRCRLLRIGGATGVRLIDNVMRRTPEYSKKNLGVAQFKRELQNMILEYFLSGDEVEFGRCVSELAPLSPEQSAELVRKVMMLAMERSGSECELGLKLLVWLCRREEIDEDAIEMGFDELYSRMPDLLLDVPDAREMALSFVVEARKARLLREGWQPPA